MKTLYCLPCGQSMLSDFLEECRLQGYKYNEVLFLSPKGYFERKEFPFRTVDLDSFCQEILARSGFFTEMATPLTQELLVKGLLTEMKAKGQLEFFAGFSESSSFCQSILGLINEFSQEAIKPEELLAGLKVFAGTEEALRAKDREILTIYLAYRALLQEKSLFDTSLLYEKAIELLEAGEIIADFQKLYLQGYIKLTALQLTLLKQLAKDCPISASLFYQKLPGYQATKKTLEDLVGLGFSVNFAEKKIGQDKDLQLFCQGFLDVTAQEVSGTQAVQLKKCANRRQEIQEVVADIKLKLLNGARPEEFLLCLRNLSSYPGLKREFDLAGIPVCMPDSVRLSTEPVTKMLLGFLQIAGGEVKKGFANLLSSVFIEARYEIKGQKIRRIMEEGFFLDFWQAEKLLKRKLAGLENYQNFLTKILPFFRQLPKFATVDIFEKTLLEFLQELKILEVLGKLFRDGTLNLAETKRLALGYESAVSTLKEITQQYFLAGEGKRKFAVESYQTLVEKTFAQKVFLLEKACEQGILVKTADQLGEYSSLYVYILGLKENEFPSYLQENWLYSDEERKLLCQLGFLASTQEDKERENFYFLAAMSQARKKLYLSVALTGSELASLYLDEVLRLAPQLKASVRLAKEVLPKGAYIANQEQLACFLKEQSLAPAYAEWFLVYTGPSFNLKLEGELPRRSRYYNGTLTEDELKKQLNSHLGLTFTASKLESYAFCPFRFLLEYVWRPAGWKKAREVLRADIKGNIYHECLKRLLNKYRDKLLIQEKYESLEKDLLHFFDLVVSDGLATEKWEETYLTWQELLGMKDILVQWLKTELALQAKNKGIFKPYATEWRFTNLPVETAVGLANLSGQIDRLDTDGKNYVVTDYKIKSAPNKADINKGLDLQIPVYLLAVEHFLGKPLGGGYFSVENAKREGGFWLNEAKDTLCFCGSYSAAQKDLAAQDWEFYKSVFTEKISRIVAGIAQGRFEPKPKEACPSFCLGQTVCRLAYSQDEDDE